MALLKDSVVTGDLRVTNNLYSTTAQFQILKAPSTSGGTDYGLGTAGYVLKTGASGVYWAALVAADIPNLAASKITSGTFDTARIPTNISITGSAGSVAWGNVSNKPIEFIVNSGSLNSNGWKTLGGRSSGAKIAISYCSANPASWNSSSYSASLVFGCADTKGLLDCNYNTPIVTFGGGSVEGSTDNDPKWYFKISGTSGKTYTFPTDSKTLVATDGTGASGTWGISITGSSASCTGNAATATAFSANKSVTLTGDVTGSASSTGGWSIATTLANSGATAGSYGDSVAQTPGYGSTFKVPYITVDAKGRVTAISEHTVKIPASDNTNTDTLVKQTSKSDDVNYKILTTTSASPTSGNAAEAAYSANIYANPSTGTLNAIRHSFNVNGDEKAYLNFNSTDSSLDLIFM